MTELLSFFLSFIYSHVCGLVEMICNKLFEISKQRERFRADRQDVLISGMSFAIFLITLFNNLARSRPPRLTGKNIENHVCDVEHIQ
jgi:hypothetical protein